MAGLALEFQTRRTADPTRGERGERGELLLFFSFHFFFFFSFWLSMK